MSALHRFIHTPKNTCLSKGLLLGIGNPLLDITVIGNQALLSKYKLKPNDAIEAEDKHHGMFQELIKEWKPTFLAGGATLNTVRVAQWLIDQPKTVSFIGCVGNDATGKILKETAESIGLDILFQEVSNEKTGVCAAIITGENRSLVAHLGAAHSLNHNFIKDNWSIVERAYYYYICGFLLPVTSESVVNVAEHACKTGKTLVMNLSAKYLCRYFVQLDLLRYIDILFGNGDEAAEFCKLLGLPTCSIKEQAKLVASLPKLNNSHPRIVIFTQGCDPTIVAYNGEVKSFPIEPVDKKLIRDTNGCGDAFVGGFLSRLVLNAKIEECLSCGNYAARTILQQYGCNFPDKPEFQLR